MDATRAIQIAVARADVALFTAWTYIRAAPWALAVMACLWGTMKWKQRKQRRKNL